MRFGLHLPNVGPLCGPAAVAETARCAEALGYDSVWVNDHLIWERALAAGHVVIGSMRSTPSADHLESLSVLAYVAGVTQRVWLGTAVLTVPLRDPLLLAKQVATLDVLSGGRVVLGVGAGGARGEFEALGMTWDGRGRAVDRGVHRMRELWASGSYRSEGGASSDVENFLPRPQQQPGPPIWVGGNSEFSLKRVIRLGDGWLPWSLTRAEYAERVPRLIEMADTAGRPLPIIGGQHLAAFDRGPGVGLERAQGTLEHRYGDRDGARERAIAGSPVAMRERLAEYASLGVEEVVLGFVSESLPELLDDAGRFADEVMPALADARAPSRHAGEPLPPRRIRSE